MPISQMATARTSADCHPLELPLVDLKKAYVNAVPKRQVFVRVPPELGLPKGTLGRLRRCCYGTRDAGQLWESCYYDVPVGMGFVRGAACPT